MEIDSRHRFRRMLDSAERYEERWRRQNQTNFEYYDGDQWTPEEMQQLRMRGQPPVVINLVGAMIDMVRSLEIQSRVDVQVVGREESDDAMASLLTALLKQVFDLAHFDYYVSKAFTDALIGGRGWIKVGVQKDQRGKDQICVDYVPWEQVYLDPFSIKPDGSDARYVIRVKWVDRDVANILFPDAADMINRRFEDEAFKGQEMAAQLQASDRGIGQYVDYRSQRIKVCECWYSTPVKKKAKRGKDSFQDMEERFYIEHEIHHVIFSDDIILKGSASEGADNPNTLKVNLYPLVPLVCSSDREGHPKGMVTNMIGLQDEINKLNSKLIHKFGTRQVLAEASSVLDPEELRQEIQRPDGLAILQDGGLSRIKVDYNTEDMGFITNHMNFALQMLQRETGVNDSTLGMGGTNERSGTIQSARIAQGNTLHTPKLENINFCKQRIAYVVLRLIGAYYTDYRVLRVTRPNGEKESYEFNEPAGDGTPLHRIEDTLDYDVILKKVAPYDSIRDRQLTIFSEVLKSGVIPQEVAAEILLSLSDIPNREEILRRTQAFAQAQTEMAQQQQMLDMGQQSQEMALAAQQAQMPMQ